MADKKSFVVYDNWSRLFCDMPDEQAGKLIKAICGYKLGETDATGDPVIDAVFNMIRVKLDEDTEHYADVCRKRSEARQNKTKEKKINDNNSKQLISNDNKQAHLYTDTDNDTDTDILPKGNINNRGRFTPPTLDEVKAYCNERGNKVDPARFIDFYESKGWMIGKNKMKDWKACIRTWEKGNKQETKPNAFTEYQQNQYDYDELERRLTANVKSG